MRVTGNGAHSFPSSDTPREQYRNTPLTVARKLPHPISDADVTSGLAPLVGEPVPLGNLLAWTVDHLVPVVQLAARGACSDLQTPHDLVLRHPVPVEQQELKTDAGETVITARHVEQERLVEDWV